MSTPKIVFFGTPTFAAEILQFLIQAGVEVVAVVTQPDRPKGRALALTPSAVKAIATAKIPKVPILQPEKASEPEFLKQLAASEGTLYVVVAFGQILPQSLLDIPPLGCINVHGSLLPKYRGAAPIQRSLMYGETETGIAIQKIVKQLDAGDVIVSAKIALDDSIVFGELYQKLCDLSKPLLLEVLRWYAQGIPSAIPQDSGEVTFAAKITPEETEIHWTKEAWVLHNLVRALSPRPGAWVSVQTNNEKKRLKVLKSQIVQERGKPGTLISPKDLIVGCGKDALQLLEVQLEGKQRMKGTDWLRGLKEPPLFY